MIDFNKEIISDKVLLRLLRTEDFGEMRHLTSDASMWYYFPSDLSDDEVLREWIKDAVQDHQQKRALPFTIIDRSNGKIIGSTRLANLSERDLRLEIGWTWIAKGYQGTGINGHVKELLFKYLFEETKVERVELKTDVLHVAAQKAMEKTGLVREGVLRSHTLMTNNRRRDTIYYSILRSEWEKSTSI
ncbi:MAG: GNAT family protein [Bacteroidota bacterium]